MLLFLPREEEEEIGGLAPVVVVVVAVVVVVEDSLLDTEAILPEAELPLCCTREHILVDVQVEVEEALIETGSNL